MCTIDSGMPSESISNRMHSHRRPQIVARAICVSEKSYRTLLVCSIVVERIARWREDGSVTLEKVLEAEEYVGTLEDMPPSDPALILSQLAPPYGAPPQENLKFMLTEVGAQKDQLEDVATRILNTNTIGVLKVSDGICSDEHDIDNFAQRCRASNAAGIDELDAKFLGGPRRKR